MNRLAIILLVILVQQSFLLPLSVHAAKSPNFIFILTDDQSWVGTSVVMDARYADSVSDSYRTPNMARIAQAGMRFTDAYAPAPYCCPTRRALLIGQTPARHVYQKNRDEWFKAYRARLNIPRMLKATNSEYRTAHFGKWDFRFDLVPPEQLGYDVSDGPTSNTEGGGRNSSKRRPRITEDPKQIFGLTHRVCNFIEETHATGKPFYVQISHYAVHLDIYAREASLENVRERGVGEKHNDPQFAAMTEDLDEGVGQLLNKVHELGLQGSTYVFFMSDNGGRSNLPRVDAVTNRNYPLRSGKGHMYEGGIRVPFFVTGPGISAGAISSVPVTGLDLLPTLAELAGYEQPLPSDIDGGSLIPVLTGDGSGKVDRSNPFLIFHHAYNRQSQSALRLDNWKLVRTKNHLELFNLSNDLGESNDLSAKMPDKTAELEKMMIDYLAAADAELLGGTKARPLGKEKPAVEIGFDALKTHKASL